jgi:predicted lipoprotein with Yx(FWY)xxD motif
MLMALVTSVALFAGACGSSSKTTSHTSSSTPATSSTSSTSASSGAVTVAAKEIKPYGKVLVNASGHALYIFAPDKAKKVTCTGACAKIWPPLTLPSGAKPAAASGVKSSLLGSDPNPSGGRVATYKGWPLYAYVTDTTAGVAHGEGLNLNGGFWYLMSPSGSPVKGKSSSSSSSSSPYG